MRSQTTGARVDRRYFRAKKKETVPCKQYVLRKFSTGKIFDWYCVNIALVACEGLSTWNCKYTALFRDFKDVNVSSSFKLASDS